MFFRAHPHQSGECRLLGEQGIGQLRILLLFFEGYQLVDRFLHILFDVFHHLQRVRVSARFFFRFLQLFHRLLLRLQDHIRILNRFCDRFFA